MYLQLITMVVHVRCPRLKVCYRLVVHVRCPRLRSVIVWSYMLNVPEYGLLSPGRTC